MSRNLKEAIGIQEAMNNLAAIAEIDLASPPPLGIIKEHRIVTNEEEFPKKLVRWLSGEGCIEILNLIDATYSSILVHFQSLYENPEMDWENEKTRRGVSAIMVLVGETAPKMEKYLAYRVGKPLEKRIVERESYLQLEEFYNRKILSKISNAIAADTEWEPKTGPSLKDFETVRQDLEYELFYIRNEEGFPYFSPEILKDLKLTVDFESGPESFEEDPFLKVRAMEDRDLHFSASQIVGECHTTIADYLKISRKYPESRLVSALNMAIFALLLAANPRHLVQNSTGKSCLDYFRDFHALLRDCFQTAEYQKWIAYPPEKSDRSAHLILGLTHQLAESFFQRVGGIKQEAIGLIHRSMRKGEEVAKSKKKTLAKGETIWNQLLIDDENMRSLMAKFPNGPLFKILDLVREDDINLAFDPILQGNYPYRAFQIGLGKSTLDLLKIPSPTKQSLINKVEILDEFRGFLRSEGPEKKARRHLLMNLQDKNSWRESARSRALESLQKNAEFSENIFVLTLPKDTDFYHQNGEYMNENNADHFLASFRKEIELAEESGYSFPSALKGISTFADSLLKAIHKHFFHNKNSLTRRHREDFIEIFYLFFTLKAIDTLTPNSMSFTCKDALDTGAAESAALFALIKILEGDFSKREDLDLFRWLMYAPALFVRERAVNVERFSRTLTALERVDGEMKAEGRAILKAFSSLVDLKNLKIQS